MSTPDIDAPSVTHRAAVIAQGRLVHTASMLATFACLLGLVGAGAAKQPVEGVVMAFLACAVLLGVAETYLAVRVGFDAALFARLGQGMTLEALDVSLLELALLPPERQDAPLTRRLQGFLRLMSGQAGATVLQYILIAMGAVRVVF